MPWSLTSDPVYEVATWVGLAVGVVSIVLAVVAIGLAKFVNDRNDTVATETVRALSEIKGNVERVRDDTASMIRTAWDRLLPTGQGVLPTDSEVTLGVPGARELAQGFTGELRAQLAATAPEAQESGAQISARLDELLDRHEEILEDLLQSQRRSGDPRDKLLRQIEALSPVSLALVNQIVGTHTGQSRHLTYGEYQQLTNTSDMALALRELRVAELLVPRRSPSGDTVFFPPMSAELLRPLLLIAQDPPRAAVEYVKRNLIAVGYPVPPDDAD